jgi:hypothetical protein
MYPCGPVGALEGSLGSVIVISTRQYLAWESLRKFMSSKIQYRSCEYMLKMLVKRFQINVYVIRF